MDSPYIHRSYLQVCLEEHCGVGFDSSHHKQCPKCASKYTFPVYKWLDRKKEETN